MTRSRLWVVAVLALTSVSRTWRRSRECLGMAYGGDQEAAERAIQRILAVSKAAGSPCAITASVRDVERRVEEGFKVIIASGQAVTIGRRAAGR